MDINNKRVLITGATGLIGVNLVDRLMATGNTVFVTGRSKEKLERTFAEYGETGRLVAIQHDAADPIPVEISDIDYIFHAAGPMERDIVMNKPVSVVLPNVLGTINCLEFLRKQESEVGKKGRFIAFSSVTVYANPTDRDYVAYEDDTTHAISLDQPYACYAESKRMTEVITRSYQRQYGIDVVIARFSTLYGWCRNIPNTAFFEFINKALAGEDIVLNGFGIPRRDNIYVDDAINGLITIASKGASSEVYNISSNGDLGNFVAVDEIAQIIAEETAKIKGCDPVKVITPNPNATRKPALVLSNSKLKKLGWVVNFEQRIGVRTTIKKIISNESV